MTAPASRGDERLAPSHDVDAERAVLSAVLVDPKLLAPVRSILARGDEWFVREHAVIWRALCALADRGAKIDEVTVADEAGPGISPVQLAELIDGTPALAHVAEHAQIVARYARKRRRLTAAERLVLALRFDDEAQAKAASRDLDHAAAPPADPFGGRWTELATVPEYLIDEPPPQEWLLTRRDGCDVGFVPRGRVGLLVATGGAGKTYAAIQLVVAVASGVGSFWLDSFRVATTGHVLLALAEEDMAEARRRLWKACNAAKLSREHRREVARRIDLVPLAGLPVALTEPSESGVVVATEVARTLALRLENRGVEWALVVLDPLSRFAAGRVEIENEAATRFVQVVESFCTARGRPAVLLTHHASQASRDRGDSDSRGVTGIRDAVRWVSSLDALTSKGGERAVRLRAKKANYASACGDVYLVQRHDSGAEGTLRAATAEEAAPFLRDPSEMREVGRATASRARRIADAAIVHAAIAREPGITIGRLCGQLHSGHQSLSRNRVVAALSELGGRVRREPGRNRTEHLFPAEGSP